MKISPGTSVLKMKPHLPSKFKEALLFLLSSFLISELSFYPPIKTATVLCNANFALFNDLYFLPLAGVGQLSFQRHVKAKDTPNYNCHAEKKKKCP